jgi:hypothetical protein
MMSVSVLMRVGSMDVSLIMPMVSLIEVAFTASLTGQIVPIRRWWILVPTKARERRPGPKDAI